MWYKKTGETLSKGNEIYNKNFELTAESDKSQEVEGWKWFDTDEQAYAYHGLTMPTNDRPSKRR